MGSNLRFGMTALMAATLLAGGCTTIRQQRGYLADPTLAEAVQPGIDNQTSVAATLGQPSFKSTYGPEVWYYVSSFTAQRPFGTPRIQSEQVLAVHFDAAGNVASTDNSGMERVARIDPDGEETPTLGRDRGLLKDLFGNIGQVGSTDTSGVAGGGPN